MSTHDVAINETFNINLQERALGEALCYFVEYGLLLLQHHRKLFTPKNKAAFEKLDYLLKYETKYAVVPNEP